MLSQPVKTPVTPEILFNNLLTELNTKSKVKGGWQPFGDLKSVEKLSKVGADIIDSLIQEQFNKKQSKENVYKALQLIYEDELKRAMNPLFCSSEDQATPGRLEALKKIMIKNFGFAGYVTPALFVSLQYDGGQGQFEAMQILCLAKLTLEQFPMHESIRLVNNYFMENSDDKELLFETKEGQAYFSGAPLNQLIEEFSKEIHYSGNAELDQANPVQKVALAYKKAQEQFTELKLSKEEKASDKSVSKGSTLHVLAALPQQVSEAKAQQPSETKSSSEAIAELVVKKEETEAPLKTLPTEKRPSFSRS